MALMDMSDLGPLAGALPQLLRPGRFAFSVTHPAFNSMSPMVDGLIEPVFEPETATRCGYDPVHTDIPPILAGRLRR